MLISILLVSIWVLWEAEVKLELDLLGEMSVKDKEKRSRNRWTGPSHHDADLTPVKGRGKEEEVGRETLGLQCGLEKSFGQASEVLPSMCGPLEEPCIGQDGLALVPLSHLVTD